MGKPDISPQQPPPLLLVGTIRIANPNFVFVIPHWFAPVRVNSSDHTEAPYTLKRANTHDAIHDWCTNPQRLIFMLAFRRTSLLTPEHNVSVLSVWSILVPPTRAMRAPSL